MNAAVRSRTVRAAHATSRALLYRALSGQIIVALEAGRLVRTGDILDRLGAGDLKDGYQSWYGRHVANAYRVATGTEPTRCWVRHRTTGRWVHVAVYSPFDLALYIGLVTYKRTAHLAQPAFYQAAYTQAA
ncbi:hypothetical protein [Streptomyces ziwulingensis]|uniref:Uncharacterized protein n=1 Tax=Streptomyces ziwulingensis TaxID=1045501 RepID=A0ABP9D4C1_9ACTN